MIARAARLLLVIFAALVPSRAEDGLTLSWQDNMLTIHGDHLPDKRIDIHYLEAYCRDNAHETDWVTHTVVGHETALLRRSEDGKELRLRCEVKDGLRVTHVITASADEIDFRITAENPSSQTSEARWAQPCVRLGVFTGLGPDDTEDAYAYIKKSFIFLDGRLALMPTKDWAEEARYTPGQVWAAPGIAGKDVNPRPLNPHTPSNGLIGCFSGDDSLLFAMAFDPYHELFQGVIRCLHSDFRLGVLEPGEKREIRGKIYLIKNDVDELLRRYRRDFERKEEGSRD